MKKCMASILFGQIALTFCLGTSAFAAISDSPVDADAIAKNMFAKPAKQVRYSHTSCGNIPVGTETKLTVYKTNNPDKSKLVSFTVNENHFAHIKYSVSKFSTPLINLVDVSGKKNSVHRAPEYAARNCESYGSKVRDRRL